MEKLPIKETIGFGLQTIKNVGVFVVEQFRGGAWGDLPRADYPAFHSNEVIDAQFVEEETA